MTEWTCTSCRLSGRDTTQLSRWYVVVGGVSALGAGPYSIGILKDSIVKYETALQTEQFLLIAHGNRCRSGHGKRHHRCHASCRVHTALGRNHSSIATRMLETLP